MKLFKIATLLGLSASCVFAGKIMTWVPSYAIAESDVALKSGLTPGPQDGITHLALQFWSTNPKNDGSIYLSTNGGLTATENDVTNFVNWGHANKIRVMLCIYNGSAGWNWNEVKPIIDNATKRTALVSNLMATVRKFNMDGV